MKCHYIFLYGKLFFINTRNYKHEEGKDLQERWPRESMNRMEELSLSTGEVKCGWPPATTTTIHLHFISSVLLSFLALLS